jgi:hypothetical protein
MKTLRQFIRYLFPTILLRNSRTVRYAFSFIFLFAAVLGMAAVSSKDSSTIKLVASKQSVEKGTLFSVDVFVYANTPVNAIDLSIAFPPEQVAVLGVDKGESVITLWTTDPYVEGNHVIMRGGTYKKGFIGEHKIATINVKALTTGQAEFLTSAAKLLAGDGKGTDVKADLSKSIAKTAILEVGAISDSALKADAQIVIITDIDSDGVVTLRDISAFMAAWSTTGFVYDFNNDGRMTFRDFSIILASYFNKN